MAVNNPSENNYNRDNSKIRASATIDAASNDGNIETRKKKLEAFFNKKNPAARPMVTKAEENLEKVNEHIKIVKENDFWGAAVIQKPDVNDEYKDLPKYLDEMVQYYKCEYDKSQGIDWHIDKDNQSLIRYYKPSTAELDPKKTDSIAWKGQLINSCRACLEVVNDHFTEDDLLTGDEDHNFEPFIKNLLKQALDDSQKKGNFSQNDLEKWNRELLEKMKEVTNKKEKNLTNKIGIALDSVALRDPHYHVTTITAIDDVPSKFAIQTSIKLDVYTKELQEELLIVSGNKQEATPKWFEALGEYEQIQARKCANLIVESKFTKVIPTQFGKSCLIPGLRNAYMESCSVIDKKHSEPHELLIKFRSGLPIMNYKDKDLTDEETTKILKLIRKFRSVLPFMNDKNKDLNDEETKKMLKLLEENKIALNSLITNSMITGEDKLYNILSRNLQNGNEKVDTPVNIINIIHWLKFPGKKDERELYRKILKLAETSLKLAEKPLLKQTDSALENLERCKILLNSQLAYFNKESNYELPARMAILLYDLKRGALYDETKKEAIDNLPEINSFCKSGKDRTAILNMLENEIVFQKYFNDTNSEDLRNFLLQSSHQQILTGMNGGTPFAFGIKGERPPQMNAKYKGQRLARDTASGNEFSASNKSSFGNNKDDNSTRYSSSRSSTSSIKSDDSTTSISSDTSTKPTQTTNEQKDSKREPLNTESTAEKTPVATTYSCKEENTFKKILESNHFKHPDFNLQYVKAIQEIKNSNSEIDNKTNELAEKIKTEGQEINTTSDQNTKIHKDEKLGVEIHETRDENGKIRFDVKRCEVAVSIIVKTGDSSEIMHFAKGGHLVESLVKPTDKSAIEHKYHKTKFDTEKATSIRNEAKKVPLYVAPPPKKDSGQNPLSP